MSRRDLRTGYVWAALLGVVLLFGAQQNASATLLYGTSYSGQRIVQIDTSTNVVTTIATTPGNPDSMVFVNNSIVYTDEKTETLRSVNLTTKSDTVLSAQFSLPADLTLTPDGKSVLVSDFFGGDIIKYTFATQTTTVFASPGGNPEGLVFDSSGRLFANLGNRFGGPTGTFVAQLDPTTGAILNTSPGLDSTDGLTFDPITGLLYATSRNSGIVYSINPNNLSQVNTIIQTGTLNTPDGITTDAIGNLFIAVQGDSRVYQYNLATKTLTPETVVPGILDDLAPASGLGSPVPEPAGLIQFGLGALSLMGYALHKRGKLNLGLS